MFMRPQPLVYGGGYHPTRGSKEHPHLTNKQRKPWVNHTIRHFTKLLREKDQGALAFITECEGVLSTMECEPQTIRKGTPKARAQRIITNVYRQQTEHRTGVFMKYPTYKKLPVGFLIVLHALATEVCIRHSGLKPTSRPRWRWVQIARSIHHLLRSDVRVYEQEDGHGNIRTVKRFTRLGLQSWNVAKQITLTLEPLYRMDLEAHHQAIAEKVLATGGLTMPLPLSKPNQFQCSPLHRLPERFQYSLQYSPPHS